MLIERDTGMRLLSPTIGGYLHNWRYTRGVRRASHGTRQTDRAGPDGSPSTAIVERAKAESANLH